MTVTGLEALLARIAACRICRDSFPVNALPHEPRPVLQAGPSARILIAGQAPGTRVHASGRPFTDPSGDRLRQWLGVTAEQFYDPNCFSILPMGFCFPGLDRKGADLPPRRECAPAWRMELMRHLAPISLVICLGAHAMRWHMEDLYDGKVDSTVRRWREGLALPVPALALPHPSWRNSGWLKRNPWFEAELLPELRSRVAALLSRIA